MKFYILMIFALTAASCAPKAVEYSPPIDQMRQLVAEDVMSRVIAGNTKIRIKNIRTELQKPDVYLVYADVEIGDKKQIDKFIARRSEGEAASWSLVPATETNLKLNGIDSADLK